MGRNSPQAVYMSTPWRCTKVKVIPRQPWSASAVPFPDRRQTSARRSRVTLLREARKTMVHRVLLATSFLGSLRQTKEGKGGAWRHIIVIYMYVDRWGEVPSDSVERWSESNKGE